MRKLLVAISATLMLTGCATATNGPDLKSVHYSGGSTSAKKFVDCLDPSERSGFDPGDGYYAYPVRQISFDATGASGSEANPISVVSSDEAEVGVPFTVTMFLKSDCDTLRAFHETIGTRFNAYITGDVNDDGEITSADYTEDWIRMLRFVVGRPFDAALDRAAQDYTWRQLWTDPEAKQTLDDAVTENVEVLIAEAAGGEFFENIQVTVYKPNPDAELKAAVVESQTRLEQIKTERASVLAEADKQEAQARADAKTAKAEVQIARYQRQARQLEIQGYGGPDAYNKYKCVTTNETCNPWQPTYIYGMPGGQR